MRIPVVLLLLLTFLFPAALFSQDNAQQDQTPTFRKSVNVVNVFFNVKDKHGALVPDLSKDNFEVFENGKPQTIKYFAAEYNQPITRLYLVDSIRCLQR